jgi:hypothetical protein
MAYYHEGVQVVQGLAPRLVLTLGPVLVLTLVLTWGVVLVLTLGPA